MAAQPNGESADMKTLRQRLKLDARTKPGMLAAAAALARDGSLDVGKVCDEHIVPAGSHGRAKALAARIVRESLLDPAPERSSAEEQWLPAATLQLTDTWIKANAPSLIEVRAEAAVASADGRRPARKARSVCAPGRLRREADR